MKSSGLFSPKKMLGRGKSALKKKGKKFKKTVLKKKEKVR